MPHLLLSTETRTRHAARSPETHEDLEPLRRQVSAIIEAILEETKPDEAWSGNSSAGTSRTIPGSRKKRS